MYLKKFSTSIFFNNFFEINILIFLKYIEMLKPYPPPFEIHNTI
jgi:hypothetical protein